MDKMCTPDSRALLPRMSNEINGPITDERLLPINHLLILVTVVMIMWCCILGRNGRRFCHTARKMLKSPVKMLNFRSVEAEGAHDTNARLRSPYTSAKRIPFLLGVDPLEHSETRHTNPDLSSLHTSVNGSPYSLGINSLQRIAAHNTESNLGPHLGLVEDALDLLRVNIPQRIEIDNPDSRTESDPASAEGVLDEIGMNLLKQPEGYNTEPRPSTALVLAERILSLFDVDSPAPSTPLTPRITEIDEDSSTSVASGHAPFGSTSADLYRPYKLILRFPSRRRFRVPE